MDLSLISDPMRMILLGGAGSFTGGLATFVVQKFLESAGYRIKKKFKKEPVNQALHVAVAGAINQTARDFGNDPAHIERYVEILSNVLQDDVVAGELSSILGDHKLEGAVWDELENHFEDSDYDLEWLGEGTGPKDLLKRFVSEFARIADMQTELQGLIQIGWLRRMAGEQKNQTGILKDQTGALNKIVRHTDPNFKISEAFERWLSRMRNRWNRLPLAELGGGGGYDDDLTMEKVYIGLDTRTPLADEEKSGGKERFLPAIEAAAQCRRLVLLGDPGSGKSSFVRSLAFHVAGRLLGKKDFFTGFETRPLPVYIELRELAPAFEKIVETGVSGSRRDRALGRALMEKIHRDLEECRAGECGARFDDFFLQGNALLLLDGLDEIPEASRPLAAGAVSGFLQEYGKIRHIIVTCRVRSYSKDTGLDHFKTHTLAPFDEEKIERFVKAWYGKQPISKGEASQKSRDLFNAIMSKDRGESLQELASNPMLLTVMAIVHQQNFELPDKRVVLYKRAVNVLLKRWQKEKGLNVSGALKSILADGIKLSSIMKNLAYKAHSRNPKKETDLPFMGLVDFLGTKEFLGSMDLAKEFLEYVDQRAGLLVGQGGDGNDRQEFVYRFPHRTFQEYFAGCFLIDERVKAIARRYREFASKGADWYDAAMLGVEALLFNQDRKRDVFDLMHDLFPKKRPQDPGQWRRALWAGKMASLFDKDEMTQDMESEETDPGFEFHDLTDRLADVMLKSPLDVLERVEAGRILGKLDDSRPGVGLNQDGFPDIEWIRIEEGLFLMGSDKDKDKYARDSETPQFTCRLIQKPFSIAKYPVTVRQYSAFIQAGGYRNKKYWTQTGWEWRVREEINGPRRYSEALQTPNHPQIGVSWHEATAFCRWLSEKTGSAISLPSEARWERAARHTDGRIYPWGDDFSEEKCNGDDTGIGHPSAVGMFPDGDAQCGASDMAGNVWEWCATKWLENYERYEDRADGDPEGSDSDRVLRGGSWFGNARDCRSAFRGRLDPGGRGDVVGFRFMRSLP
ncbi:hypothetical protein EPICR_30332 [Candidatus Desulfarcum epimagneticum]|uniref:NACHT domain-containing protein n=1 Tax=uncultured Desulfobacteraceae bacterium TaxID=218296 RepID=A0A484HNA1_9BACT|nr:hypothetical protein EPICR_30332 [uncultured Desulfobacteraceae bacterium]